MIIYFVIFRLLQYTTKIICEVQHYLIYNTCQFCLMLIKRILKLNENVNHQIHVKYNHTHFKVYVLKDPWNIINSLNLLITLYIYT